MSSSTPDTGSTPQAGTHTNNPELNPATFPTINGSTTNNASTAKPVNHDDQAITIIQADGLYPDTTTEDAIFSHPGNPDSPFTPRVHYEQLQLWPPGSPTPKPWSSIPSEMRKRINGIMVLKIPFTSSDADLFPNLKVFLRMGVGYDMIDRRALHARGITFCNLPDYGTGEVADHALALALSLRRGVLLHHDRQRHGARIDEDASTGKGEGTGKRAERYMYVDTPLVHRLQGETFGVIGLGRIGTAAALRAKAFGWNVLWFDPYRENGWEKAMGIERTKDVRELFKRSGVVSVHCPCTKSTRGLVGWEMIRLMKPGSVLVNTARGEVVDLDGVERGLREDILAGAGLDVLANEPIPLEDEGCHSLIRAYRNREPWLEGRMVLTCHTAFYSAQSFVDIRVKSAETMRNVLVEGGRENVVGVDED